jgi:iron complex outermembrane receptor protein
VRHRERNIRPICNYAWPTIAAGCAAFAWCPAEAQNSAAAQAAAETAPEQSQLPDIIITARRRPEPLQRTPVSVIALTRADLESRSVTNLRSLQNFVPNLTFAPSQNVGEAAANVFIRGIGQEDFGVGAEAGVAFYVDGVYFPRSLGLLMNLTDVAQIEVLRGPQGTLYGKDAIGGAINVISTMPGPRRERNASAIIGNDSRVELRTIVNEPLSDRLFLRLGLGLVNRGGYLHRLSPPAPLALVEQANGEPVDLHAEGDDRGQGGRLQLRWLVTDSFTADLSVDGSRKRDRQGPIHIDLIDPSAGDFPLINELVREGKLPGPEITNALAPANLLESYAANRNFTDQEFWGISTVLARQLGASTLKFIGSYRELHSHVGTDDDGLYFDLAGNDLEVRQRQYSGELQLTGAVGRLSYSAGLYGFVERPRLLPTRPLPGTLYTCGCFTPEEPPIFTIEDRQILSESYAGYAQGTYRVGDRLSATLGARYTHERKRLQGKEILADANLQPTDIIVDSGDVRDSWNALTYRAGLEFQASSRVMAYASIARGFKSGGFNVRGEIGLPNMGFVPFDPETALTTEIGVRSEWLHRKLRFNATVFHTSYKDIQLRQDTLIDGIFTTLIENAAKARIRGAEIEAVAAPLKGLTLTASYGHLDPKFLDVGQVRGLTLDSDFQRTPHHSFSGSLDYELPVRAGIVELHGDYSYRSKEQFQILAASNDQKGYGLLGARIAFRSRDERWAVALFGTNLTDKRYRTAGRGTLIDRFGFAYSSVGMPRQLGVQVTTGF